MSLQPLRVAIFPYIPDLAGDELAGLGKTGELVEVYTKGVDPYDLNALEFIYLTDGEDAYDLMEVDTVLLGELVKTGRLQPLEDHFKVTRDVFDPSAVHSLPYSPHLKSHLYIQTVL